jgi:hypothetical protein
MTRCFGLILITLLFSAAVPAQQADIVGTWDITIESPNGKRDSLLIIKKEGDKLAGAMKSPRGERPLDSVTLNGSDITLVMSANVQGQNMVFTFKGKLENGSMKGDADFGGFAAGSWSAVPHKEEAAMSSAPAAPAGAVNITGTWDFTVETPNGSGTPVFTFKQDGETLTGDYKGQLGEAPLTGTVKGSDVKFSMKLNFQGQDFTVTYTGKVDGNSMKGTAALGEIGEGSFTAKKR